MFIKPLKVFFGCLQLRVELFHFCSIPQDFGQEHFCLQLSKPHFFCQNVLLNLFRFSKGESAFLFLGWVRRLLSFRGVFSFRRSNSPQLHPGPTKGLSPDTTSVVDGETFFDPMTIVFVVPLHNARFSIA